MIYIKFLSISNIKLLQPLAIRGLQVSIECLRLSRCRTLLSESCKFLPLLGTTTNGGSAEIKEEANRQLQSTALPAGEGNFVVPAERLIALVQEMESLRERVRDLECQMSEAMTMLTRKEFPCL